MTRRRPDRDSKPAAPASHLAALEAEVRDLREQLALERLDFQTAQEGLVEAQRELEMVCYRNADLYETAPIAFVLLDRNGFIRDANLRTTELLSMPRQRLHGLLLAKFVVKEDRRKLLSHLGLCRRSAGGEEVSTELKVKNAGGQLFDVVLTSRTQPQPPTPPAAVRFRTALVDVTARKAAERRQQRSEEQFRALIKASSDAVYRMSPDWTEMRHLVGREFIPGTDQPSSTWLEKYIPPDDQAHVLAAINEAIRTKSVFELEHRVLRVDGTLGWTHSRAIPIRDAEGEIIEWFGMASDVTSRKQAEHALRAQQQLLKSITENADVALFIMDKCQYCVFMNPAAELLTGFTKDEVRAKPLHEYVHHTRPDGTPYPLSECPIDQAFPESKRMQGEEVFVHKDGHFYHVAFTASPLSSPTGESAGTIIEVQDITARKQAEEARRTSEERFRHIFEYAGTGIAIADMSGRFLQCNPAYCSILGYSEEELRSLVFSDLIHPEDREENLQTVQTMLEHKQPSFEIENRYIHKAGHAVWVHKFISLLYGNDGKATHFIALVTDITERKRNEAVLQEWNATLEMRVQERTVELAAANERWDWVVRATHDGVWDWDLVHDTVYFSPRWKEMHGFQGSDSMESVKDWSARIHPDDRPRVMEHLEAYFAGKWGEFWEEYRIQRKDGTYFWILDRGIAIRDEQGRVVRMVGSETDISWRKDAEQALRRREQEFRMLADNVPALFSYIDKEHCYRFVNKRYEELFGRPNEEIVGTSVRDLLGPEGYAEVQSYLDKALQGDPVLFEYCLTIPGSSPHYFSAQYVPDRDAQGQVVGLFVLLDDMTAFKSTMIMLREREAQLRELSTKLMHAQEEERRRISRDLHDDVMQRLGGLALELHSLADSASLQDQQVKSQIKACGTTAEQLTTDLQEMAHQLHPAILEYARLETAMREHVDEFARRTGISAEFVMRDVPKDVPLEQSSCLYRVLQEGLQNVQKHANATTVLVRLVRTGQGIGLCIHDDGGGIEEPDGTARRKGLGLISMAERVSILNGTFRIRTKHGDGTELHAWVPLDDVKCET